MTDKAYQIFLTPLIENDCYGDEVEISDFVDANFAGIKKNTDSDDYVIGEYLLGSVVLTCVNFQGKFNEDNPGGFFPTKRDRAKIRVVYFDSLTDSSASFKGLITDEGTRGDDDTDLIKIKVLALDSILRKVQVVGGLLSDGDLFSTAIKLILNVPGVTSVLTFDENEIDVDFDLTTDTVASFSDVSTWDALKLLLIASNSVVYVDDETIKVKARDADTGLISYFYGPGDTLDRENIVKISNHNNGHHRIFNSIKINNTIITDDISKETFGLRQKPFTLAFITDSDKEILIARNLVEQFRYPKIEFQMTVNTALANEADFFDTIGVSHPVRAKPFKTTNMPLYGTAKYNTESDVYPVTWGGVIINGEFAFQIIQRTENPGAFQTTLKLRQRGKTFDDGVLIFWLAVYGFSKYGISTY